MLSRRGRLVKPNLAKGSQKAAPKEISQEIPPEPVTEEVVVPESEEGIAWPPMEKRISRLPPRDLTPPRCLSPEDSMENKNEKKKFNGQEMLDTKNMRIMDMIYWNPKKGQILTRKRTLTESSSISTPAPPKVASATGTSRSAAPQVKIGPDGTIVLDESSLIIEGTQNDTSFWETVDDDRMGRKTTSLSFRSRLWRKGTQWTDKETELFYEILRCTGPDFSLMHEYFPARARCELKSKYNREERSNWDKLKDVMSSPSVLDETLLSRVERLQGEIAEEAEFRANSKEKLRSSKGQDKGSKESATIDWEEATADLQAEAEELIHELEKEYKRKARAAGDLDDSSSESGESSTEEYYAKQVKAKKKVSLDARKLITAARKQAMETETAKKAEEKEKKKQQNYKGFEEVEETPEDPAAVQVLYPLSKTHKDGVVNQALMRAAKVAKKASEKLVKEGETSKELVEEEELTLKSVKSKPRIKRAPNIPKN